MPVVPSLPMTPEEITPAWLTAALVHSGHNVQVENVEIVHIVWGTATKVRIRATYAGGVRAGGPPENLCVKGGMEERMRAWAVAAGFHIEVAFYGQLAPRLQVRVPRCWFAGTDPHSDQALIVLDDLVANGCDFGDPKDPFTPDQVASGLEQLALVHGPTWGWSKQQVPWLTVGSTTVRTVMGQLWAEPRWSEHFAKPQSPRLPPELDDNQRMIDAFAALWARDDAALHCVLHGDTHIGNTYLAPDKTPSFLDWQMMCLSPWSHDLAYFLAGAMTVDDRRAHERDLVRHYLDALAAAGGPALSWDEAWNGYRIDLFHGLMWAACDESMQPLEITSVMADRYIAATVDHNTITMLNA